MTTVTCDTITPGAYPATVRVRHHTFTADVDQATGGEDTAPDPHDHFDTALATCKAMTAMWYAKKKGIPLERVHAEVERDASAERGGVYRLKVRVTFEGAMTDEQRGALHRAIGACPIHKLMTTSEVQIDTVAP